MEGCLSELRRHTRLDLSDLRLGSGLLADFDGQLRAQLDLVWASVGPHTKQASVWGWGCRFVA